MRLGHVLAVVADEPHAQRQRVVVGDHQAAFAGVDLLVVVQAETADVADPADRTSAVENAGRLRGILDDLEIALPGDGHDGVHVGRVAEQVHCHDGLCPPGDLRFDAGGIDA